MLTELCLIKCLRIYIVFFCVLHNKHQDKFPEAENIKTLQHVGRRPPNQRTQKMANVINSDKTSKKGKHILCYWPEYYVIVDMIVLHSHDQPDMLADSPQ
jgi:hypothetical protein